MTDVNISKVDAEIIAIADRARKAGWDHEWISKIPSNVALQISVPNGRIAREVKVTKLRASFLEEFNFEEFRVLGNYNAINNPGTGYIEAFIQPTDNYSFNSIQDMPVIKSIGIANPSESVKDDREGASDEDQISREGQDAFNWQLKVRDEQHSWSLEISLMTDKFAGLISGLPLVVSRSRSRRRPTLKILGIDAPKHDDAVQKLEVIGNAFLFDLDLRYGVSYELSRRSLPRFREYQFKAIEQPPVLPRLNYPNQALSLYNYGRSAFRMPLLQFLAFYQVLEFFFPMHSQREVLRRLRQVMADPRFNIGDDADLARILQLASANNRSGYGNEKDQLKATIYGCVDNETMLTFFRSDAELFRPLTDKKPIRGIPVIDEMNRGIPLLDQVVTRVYALRNRVVHAKAEGGETAVELLLPGSVEADSMTADIVLLRFLAQKAIIAGAAQLA